MNYLTYSKLKITHFFDKFILQRKSVQQAQPLNIVQSVQNFAHKLILLCVTRTALWSYAFPTFRFWVTLIYIYIFRQVLPGLAHAWLRACRLKRQYSFNCLFESRRVLPSRIVARRL